MLSLTLTRQHWSLLIGLILALGGVFIGATRVRPPADGAVSPPAYAPAAARAPAPEVGHPAPLFTLVTPDGTTIALEDLRGQVVLINIWATWCPPCRAEMPAIEAVYARHAADGFVVLAVNQREEPALVAAYLREHGLSFPAPLDRDGRVGAAYRASALPSSFFLDRQGVVRAVYRGPLPRAVIAGTVEQLLQEQP